MGAGCPARPKGRKITKKLIEMSVLKYHLLCITGQVPSEGPLSILHEQDDWQTDRADRLEGALNDRGAEVLVGIDFTQSFAQHGRALHKKSAPRLVLPEFIQVW